VKKLVLFAIVMSLATVFAAGAFARDARLDFLVNQGKVTEEQITAAETQGPSTWMARNAYDVTIGGYVQIGWEYVDGADPDNEFSLTRARIRIEGRLSDAWGFVISPEFADDAGLRDVGVRYEFGGGSVFVGQTKMPFILENITSSSRLDTINRSAPARRFDDRDLGLFVDYALLEGRVGLEAAVTNGTGTNEAEENDKKDYTVRVWGKPFLGSEGPADGLTVAAAYSMGDHAEYDEFQADIGDFEHSAWVASIQWVWNALKVQGEYVDMERDRGPGGKGETTGWYAYATYDLPVDGIVVTPVVKYETLDPNAVALGVCRCSMGEWITLGVRISFVGTHDVKLEANYIIEDVDAGEDVDELFVQLQASF
jgi:phosphate-selective porin